MKSQELHSPNDGHVWCVINVETCPRTYDPDMNETSTVDILAQLEAAEQRLAPFTDNCNKWITDNDQKLLSRVLRAVAKHNHNNNNHNTSRNTPSRGKGAHPSRQQISSPSFALTAALAYLKNHRHSMSPISSPLVKFNASPCPDATSSTTTSTRSSTTLSTQAPTTDTASTATATAAVKIKKPKTGKKKKRAFGAVLHVNTLHNTSKNIPFNKQKTMKKNSAQSVNVMETF